MPVASGGYGAWCGFRTQRWKICANCTASVRTYSLNACAIATGSGEGIRLPIGKDFLARLEAVMLFDGSGPQSQLGPGMGTSASGALPRMCPYRIRVANRTDFVDGAH